MGGTFEIVAFAYVSIALIFFVLRSLRHTIIPEGASTLSNAQRRKRIHFLLGIALLQIFLSYLLISRSYKSSESSK